MDKTCTKCLINKPTSEFHNDKSRNDGHSERCKSCKKEYKIQYRKDNPEKILLWNRGTYSRHKERIQTKHKKWRENNKEEVVTYHAKYRKTLVSKMSKKNGLHIRRTAKKQGDVTTQQLKELYEKSTHCFYCKCNLSNEIKTPHLDHYIPLSKGGLHTISNLVIACSTCNLSKHNKLPEEFILTLRNINEISFH